jgi:hypothetical protein
MNTFRNASNSRAGNMSSRPDQHSLGRLGLGVAVDVFRRQPLAGGASAMIIITSRSCMPAMNPSALVSSLGAGSRGIGVTYLPVPDLNLNRKTGASSSAPGFRFSVPMKMDMPLSRHWLKFAALACCGLASALSLHAQAPATGTVQGPHLQPRLQGLRAQRRGAARGHGTGDLLGKRRLVPIRQRPPSVPRPSR